MKASEMEGTRMKELLFLQKWNHTAVLAEGAMVFLFLYSIFWDLNCLKMISDIYLAHPKLI